ncbi:hypothetical protein B0H13DRAFT_226033 [Mycena leptocephala]|nr:hypothetical protein B0H13DRAFT_226033 [Mycena leptocephala]
MTSSSRTRPLSRITRFSFLASAEFPRSFPSHILFIIHLPALFSIIPPVAHFSTTSSPFSYYCNRSSGPSFVASITQTHSPRRQCPSPKPSPNVLRSTAAGRRPPDPGDSDAFRGPHAGENVVRGSSSLPSFGLPSIGVNLRVLRSNECGQHLISQWPFFCP